MLKCYTMNGEELREKHRASRWPELAVHKKATVNVRAVVRHQGGDLDVADW
jgi:hypothetical protein